jgi:hypothetical protein
MKRGLTRVEAMDYVGVKRRTFDALWRPRLIAIPQGSSLIFDRADLDRLFDELKASAAASLDEAAVCSLGAGGNETQGELRSHMHSEPPSVAKVSSTSDERRRGETYEPGKPKVARRCWRRPNGALAAASSPAHDAPAGGPPAGAPATFHG